LVKENFFILFVAEIHRNFCFLFWAGQFRAFMLG